MRKLLLLSAVIFCIQMVSAFPAIQQWLTVKQSDGTSLRVTLCGDEHFNYYNTADDVPLVKSSTGDYFYASVLGFRISSTGVLAHEVWERSELERSSVIHIDNLLPLQRDIYNLSRQAEAKSVTMETKAHAQIRRAAASDGRPKRGLVIMASFSDLDFSSTKSEWNDILNKEGYSNSEHGCIGSVHDYFYEQSSGKFNLSFDVVQVKLPKSRYYYGENNEYGNDKNVGEMVYTACNAIKVSVNFSDYDWDGDGNVDQVFILFAGCPANIVGSGPRLIWPHEYNLSSYDEYSEGLTLDGVKINQYACSSERKDLESSIFITLSGLGIFCHEFSHCLGLMDLYTYTGLNIIQSWDVMAYGGNNNKVWTPSNYSSYEKTFCGWETPVVLSSDTTITDVASVTDKGAAYKIINKCSSGKVDEYYTLENRQNTGWDKYLPGHGLLIFHVDYDSTMWSDDNLNYYADHPRLMIVPANNMYSEDANVVSGFAYPYVVDGKIVNDSLTDESSPAADVFNCNVHDTGKMNQPVTSILENDGKISFRFGTESFDYEICSVNGLRYRINNGKATLAHQIPDEIGGKVTVPSSFDYKGTTYTVTSAVDGCFKGCTSLTSVTFPRSITRISPSFFYDCTSLASILVDGENPNYSSDGAALYNKDKSELVYVPKQALTDSTYVIPSTVTSLGDSAFYNIYTLRALTIPETVTSIGRQCFATCGHLTSVILPKGLTSIGDGCFYYCVNLSSVTVPDKVTYLGDDCFYNCVSLTSAVIPDGVTHLGNNCFRRCLSLTSITIPNTVTAMGQYCFAYCQSLTSVVLPDKLKEVSGYCFYYCKSLTSVFIPESVVKIGNNCFHGCTSLASISIPSSVTELGSNSFSACSSLKEVVIPNSVTILGTDCFALGNSLRRVTLPDQITELPTMPFAACSLLDSVVIPNSVKSIDYGCFAECGSLSYVKLSDALTLLGKQAFYNCMSIDSIDIPKSVESIVFGCFMGCTSLKSVKCHWQTPLQTAMAFYGLNLSGDTLYVPMSTVDDYKAVSEWSGFGKMIGYDDSSTAVLSPSTIGNEDKNAPYYNLQGVRIQKPTQKGIYVHQDKKIIVK